MKKPKTAFVIPLEVYGLSVGVVLGYENIGEALKDEETKGSYGITFCVGTPTVYVAFESKEPTHDVIAHELFHVCSIIAHNIGHDHRQEDEPMAYLCGYLHKKMYEGLAKAKAPKKESASLVKA